MGILSWLFRRRPERVRPERVIVKPGIGSATVDILPHTVRAIGLFGGIAPDKAPWLARMVATHFHEGRIAERIAKDGTLLDDAERQSLGLPKWPRVTRETIAALEPEARRAPVEHLDRLVGRIAAWTYDEVDRTGEAGGLEPGWRRVIVAQRGCCAGAAALRRRKFRLGQQPPLPLHECLEPDCQCRWELDRPKR